MSLPVRRRWLLLGGLLTATLAAAAWVHERDANDALIVVAERPQVREKQRHEAAPAPEAAPVRVARNDPPRNDVPQVRLDRLDARQLGDATRDPFAPPVTRTKRATPKPAPVVIARPAPPPPPPSAPPLPFKYMGKLASSDGVSVFLIHGDRNLVVHEGDTIASQYRVDRIGETTMALTYLPLDQPQTLNFGETR